MKTVRVIEVCLAAALIFSNALLSAGAPSVGGGEGGREKASRVWEQAVAAKGGRERLYGVRSLVELRGKGVELHVFPSKYWSWGDDRPSPIGLSVEMHNLERGLAYLTYPDDPESPRTLGKSGRGWVPLRDAQLYYLLETQWVKPVLVGAAEGRAGRRPADVVRTLVGGVRVDFYFDRESHLPLKVAFPVEGGGPGTYYVEFSDYAPLAGVQMPRKVSYLGGGFARNDYELNVAYDESVFERPPTIEGGPHAWRK